MHIETGSVKRFDFTGLRDYEAPYVEPIVEDVIEEIEAEQVQEAPAPPPAVTFSESDMEGIKAAAKQEGYQQGLQEADAATQKEIQAQNEQSITLLKQIQQQLSMMHMEYEKQVDTLTHDANALSLHVAQMVASKTLETDVSAPAEALLRECLPHLMQSPEVALSLHPETATMLDTRINNIAKEQHFAGNITIEPKDSLAPSDAILSWSGGSAEQRLENAWQEIKTRILPESYYGHLERKTSTPLTETATSNEVLEETVEVTAEEIEVKATVEAQAEIAEAAEVIEPTEALEINENTGITEDNENKE